VFNIADPTQLSGVYDGYVDNRTLSFHILKMELKVLSNGKEEWVWMVSIASNISADFKNCLKDPGPLNSKNVFEQLNNSTWGISESMGVRG
jgi:hypothetical protein